MKFFPAMLNEMTIQMFSFASADNGYIAVDAAKTARLYYPAQAGQVVAKKQ
jgi:hypothetical protein